MTPPTTAEVAVDLTDPRVHAEDDLGPLFAQLRRDRPLAWADPGFWVVSRHADVLDVLRDTTRFSSARGNMLGTLLAGGDSAGGRMLVVTDPPRHPALRGLLRRAFSPRALAALGERIRVTADRLWARAVDRGGCDVAADVAAHIPLTVICDLLGVPEADRAFILRQTSAALSSHEAVPSSFEARMAQGEILLYFARLARARQGQDQADPDVADVVSLLANGLVDGERLTEDELVLNCYSLILGGDETTRLSMVGGIRALAEHPDQWARLRSGEVAVSDAVEEILRWTAPLLHSGRTATEDVTLHGRTIRAGDVVTVWYPSANRDTAEFSHPELFDVGRRPNRHLTFAHGAHFCLGAHLARVELTALLDSLLSTVDSLEPAGPPRPVYSTFLTGLASLPVTVRPRRDAR